MCLYSKQIDDKTNEIPNISLVLDKLNIKNAVIKELHTIFTYNLVYKLNKIYLIILILYHDYSDCFVSIPIFILLSWIVTDKCLFFCFFYCIINIVQVNHYFL